MRRLAILLGFLGISLFAGAQTYDCYNGSAQQGGNVVTVNGIQSAQSVQQSFPASTVSVFNHGTVTLSTIYATDTGTAKVNPFTVSSKGVAFWCAADGTYDVQYSGTGITIPFTITDIHICHACAGGGGGGTPGGLANSIQVNLSGSAFGGVGSLTSTGGSLGTGVATLPGDLSLAGQLNMTGTGGTVQGFTKSAGTSITVPAGDDCGWFLGSDNALHGQLSVALGGTPCLTFASVGGVATTAQIPDLSATYVTQSQAVINAGTGFQIGGAAPSGHALVGNGTNYVDQAISLGGTITSSAAAGNAYYPAAGTTVQADTSLTDNGAGALTSTQGSITASTPWLNHTATWNAAGAAFIDYISNITCTAAAVGAKHFALQVGGTDQFSVNYAGANCTTPFLKVPAGAATQAGLVFAGDTTAGLARIGSNSFGFTNGTKFFTKINNTTFAITNSTGLCFSNNATDATATPLACLASPSTSSTGQMILSSVTGGDNATPTGSVLLRASATTAGATNTAGSNFILSSGMGTGNASPTQVIVQAPAYVAASGTGQQTNVDRVRTGMVKTLSTTSGTANNVIQVTLATLQSGSGSLFYVLTVTDGVDICSLSGRVQYALVLKGATYTGDTISPAETGVRSGTPCASFSTAWAWSTNTLQVTPTFSGITATSAYLTYTVLNLGDASITPQ